MGCSLWGPRLGAARAVGALGPRPEEGAARRRGGLWAERLHLQLQLSLRLVDSRRDPGELDLGLLEWFHQTGRPCLIVATKVDKLANSKRKSRLAAVAKSLGAPPRDVIPFSSLSKQGRDAVWGTILAFAEGSEAAGE